MDEILYRVEDHIATLTLNRPERLNAFTRGMVGRWASLLRQAQEDPDVRVVVVTGSGRGFCSGVDMDEFIAVAEGSALDQKRFLWENVHRIPLTLEDLDKPVICAVNGTAVGAGLDMALMCDLRFAAEGARLSEGYINVGLVPGDGGTYFLPRLVGVARALDLFWTGEPIDASQAERIGMVNAVWPADQLMAQTYAYAAKLCAKPQLALRMMKRAVYASVGGPDLRSVLDMISSHMAVVQQTDEHRQFVRDFVANRRTRGSGSGGTR